MEGKCIRHPEHVKSCESLYYFKKEFEFQDPQKSIVKLMADARYKLWINGELASLGPCKGDRHLRYYDEIDITSYLKKGKNLFEVTVLSLPNLDSMDTGYIHIASVLRTGDGFFWMDGVVEDQGETVKIQTDSTWMVSKENHDTFSLQFFVGMNEHTTIGYKTDVEWVNAQEIERPVLTNIDEVPFGEIFTTYSKKNELPKMMYEKGEFSYHDGYYDAGKLMTGYIKLQAHGTGKITLRYGECFVDGNDKIYTKGNRIDTKLHLLGHNDTFEVDGTLDFDSFWFRTFRFCQITTDGDVTLDNFYYYKTGYPLELTGTYDFGSQKKNELFEISFRTLLRCMQETYVDCPYYEQLQYCQDTYAQIMFTYMITDDMRLPKKAVHDFTMSWQPGFITEARTPSCKRQYITGFSLFYVLMVDKYFMRTNDVEEVEKCLPVIDGVLTWFEHHKNQNGLIAESKMWDFVDWASAWTKNEGAPVVKEGVGNTIYSLMYAYALQRAGTIFEKFNRCDIRDEYLNRSRKVLEDVQKATFDEKQKLYYTSDERNEICQHTQVWAVLSGLCDGLEAKELLKKSNEIDESLRGGYAYSYLIFRAYEKAGCYELSKQLMDDYYGLLDKNCSTIPETPATTSRSECHAWGAVALYEFTTMTLGVKFTDDILTIQPRIDGETHASGTVFTRFGKVEVSWKVVGIEFYLDLKVEEGTPIKLVLPMEKKHNHVTINGNVYLEN